MVSAAAYSVVVLVLSYEKTASQGCLRHLGSGNSMEEGL